jgi:hypothetical protein
MCSIARLFFWENGTSIFDDSVDSVVIMASIRRPEPQRCERHRQV